MRIAKRKATKRLVPEQMGIQEIGVNAAFLSDIKDDEQEVPTLVRTVNEMLAADSLSESDAQVVLVLLRRLFLRLKSRFQLEDAIGYMEDVVAVAPRLCRKSEVLQHEHQPLLEQLLDVVEVAHLHFRKDKLSRNRVRLVAEVFAEFRESFLAHEAAETDLIYEALYLDLGVGG